MKFFLILCVVCLQSGWSYGAPDGLGAFAYQDSSGNRITDEDFLTVSVPPAPKIHRIRSLTTRDMKPLNRFLPFQSKKHFSPYPLRKSLPSLHYTTLPALPSLKPYHKSPFESSPAVLAHFSRRVFNSNLAIQRKALEAARKAFDLTSNQAGYVNNLPFRSPFGDFSFPTFPTFDMSFPNSAYAGGAVGPGFSHQVASINPENPNMPNVNIMSRFGETPQSGNNFVSMSSRAYSVSSNVNGKETSDRGAVTTVNDNGKITTYSVKN